MFVSRASGRPGSVPRRTTLAALAACLSAVATAGRAQALLLRIGGTGMALATMRQLGDAFVAVAQATQVRVLPSLGTGGGLAAVAAGSIDLALSARALNEKEAAGGLRALAYARTPVAFVSHPGAGVQDITLAQVALIFSGQMSTWPDGTPVRLIRRDPSDADWTMLRALSPEMAEAARLALARPGLLTAATDQDNADALEHLPGSFGAMSIGQLRAEARQVVPLALDGIPPSIDALLAGRYPLSRTLYAVWRDPLGPDLARFLEFLASASADQTLARLGHIPLAGKTA